MTVLDFRLPAELEAYEPPEARGLPRDGVRLLVGRDAVNPTVEHRAFAELPGILRSGDLLLVNTSGTLPAAVPTLDGDLMVHFSTERPDGSWLVELRRSTAKATVPHPGGTPGDRHELPGGAAVTLRERYSPDRLWIADVTPSDVLDILRKHGHPIRYRYVRHGWPLRYYQTVFATEPGSAEMPSAARPFSHRLVTRLVAAGVGFAPVLLHTGVASPEHHERPYPERFAVPEHTARLINQTRHAGGRVIAVGTTAVRAVETAADSHGQVNPATGWTDLIITPERGVRAVDGLLTGFHEPLASHLDMLAAIAGRDLLDTCYRAAIQGRYLWHEFGDLNLLVP
jgi:S-adenosylmethionine:tRNA ribosyltransferase-isomerase